MFPIEQNLHWRVQKEYGNDGNQTEPNQPSRTGNPSSQNPLRNCSCGSMRSGFPQASWVELLSDVVDLSCFCSLGFFGCWTRKKPFCSGDCFWVEWGWEGFKNVEFKKMVSKVFKNEESLKGRIVGWNSKVSQRKYRRIEGWSWKYETLPRWLDAKAASQKLWRLKFKEDSS